MLSNLQTVKVVYFYDVLVCVILQIDLSLSFIDGFPVVY